MVVAPPDWEEPAILLAEELGAGKVTAGRSRRGDAGRLGARRRSPRCPRTLPVVLVHDAARPLVTEAVVERVLAPLGEGCDGAAPGASARRHGQAGADGDVVRETVDRSGLYAVQTPQAFVDARCSARRSRAARAATAPAFVEAAGGRVRVVEGDPALFKVTTPADLALAERLLAS